MNNNLKILNILKSNLTKNPISGLIELKIMTKGNITVYLFGENHHMEHYNENTKEINEIIDELHEKKFKILIEKPIVSRFNMILDDIDLSPNKLAKEVDKNIIENCTNIYKIKNMEETNLETSLSKLCEKTSCIPDDKLKFINFDTRYLLKFPDTPSELYKIIYHNFIYQKFTRNNNTLDIDTTYEIKKEAIDILKRLFLMNYTFLPAGYLNELDDILKNLKKEEVSIIKSLLGNHINYCISVNDELVSQYEDKLIKSYDERINFEKELENIFTNELISQDFIKLMDKIIWKLPAYYTDLYCSSLILELSHKNNDDIEIVVVSGAHHTLNLNNILKCFGFNELKHEINIDQENQLMYI